MSTSGGKGPAITFTPSVFEVPEGRVEKDLIAVMTPFASGFEPVFGAIPEAAQASGYRVLRAKDIWEHSTVIQDVFSLIFKAHIVFCDFTDKNPNVFLRGWHCSHLGQARHTHYTVRRRHPFRSSPSSLLVLSK